MAPWKPETLRRWLSGDKSVELSYADVWRALLIGIGDRVEDLVDEEGRPLRKLKRNAPFYDLLRIAQNDGIKVGPRELLKIAALFEHRGWVSRPFKPGLEVSLTRAGYEKCLSLLDETLNNGPQGQSVRGRGGKEEFGDWLLVEGFKGFELGRPFSEKGMDNLRAIADRYSHVVSDDALDETVNRLEVRDLLQRDTGPSEGRFWVNYNTAGVERASLLQELWRTGKRVPSASGFVRLDDNLPSYNAAVLALEQLVTEAAKIRVNDWPEKEGVIETLKSALQMVKTKYVNKPALIAVVSSAAGFILSKFAEAPIAELAERAWEAVKSLL
jgi:hypothetical protein